MSNTALSLKPDYTVKVRVELEDAVAQAWALPDIVDASSCEQAQAGDTRLNKAIKALAAERLDFTRKLDAVKKVVLENEKALTKDAVEAQKLIAEGIDIYLEALRAEASRREAEAKAREVALAEAEEGEEHIMAPLVVAEPMAEVPNLPTRRVTHVLVNDPLLLPRKFLDPNESRIKAALEAGEVVPGAHLTYEDVRVRR